MWVGHDFASQVHDSPAAHQCSEEGRQCPGHRGLARRHTHTPPLQTCFLSLCPGQDLDPQLQTVFISDLHSVSCTRPAKKLLPLRFSALSAASCRATAQIPQHPRAPKRKPHRCTPARSCRGTLPLAWITAYRSPKYGNLVCL